MTMLGEELDLVILDESNGDVPCDNTGWLGGPEEPCPRAAEWIAKGDCGHTTIQCDEHKRLDDEGYPYVCDCGVESEPLNWRRL